jgi:hypothetical protein
MKGVLLVSAAALAAFAAYAAPAGAQSMSGTSMQFSESRNLPDFKGDGRFDRSFDCGFRHGRGFRRDRDGNGDGDRRHRRHRRSICDVSVGTFYEGGEWALYNNRSWESDSFNDWWHDRPDRAYPAWMRRNQNCERAWISGDTRVC